MSSKILFSYNLFLSRTSLRNFFLFSRSKFRSSKLFGQLFINFPVSVIFSLHFRQLSSNQGASGWDLLLFFLKFPSWIILLISSWNLWTACSAWLSGKSSISSISCPWELKIEVNFRGLSSSQKSFSILIWGPSCFFKSSDFKQESNLYLSAQWSESHGIYFPTLKQLIEVYTDCEAST